jgi:hypothetical protein
MARAASVIVVDLGAGPFQEAVVVKQFQPPQKLLLTAGNERTDMGRAHKAKPLHKADDFAVALGELHGDNCGGTFEAGKAAFHACILRESDKPGRRQVLRFGTSLWGADEAKNFRARALLLGQQDA